MIIISSISLHHPYVVEHSLHAPSNFALVIYSNYTIQCSSYPSPSKVTRSSQFSPPIICYLLPSLTATLTIKFSIIVYSFHHSNHVMPNI